MEIEMNHFSHRHLLILKKNEEIKTNSRSCKCDGCHEPISGPFYSCKEECCYFLHKVCAELPEKMNHPVHPQHPLTLLQESPYRDGAFICSMCRISFSKRFVYNCSVCYFDIDVICATASHVIKDKCHAHPLTPVQLPSSFLCHICREEEKCVSYKCTICPFWVHQNCTLLPDTVECSDHDHQLTILPSIPSEFYDIFTSSCDICHYKKMTTYETVYSCVECRFFAHANCAVLSSIQPSNGKEDARVEDHDVIHHKPTLLPVRKDWASLISLIFGNTKGADNLTKDEFDRFPHNHLLHLHDDLEHNSNSDNGNHHFSHDHVLHLHDGQLNNTVCGKVCEACAQPIYDSPYGCTQCDYFLHKCCMGLPQNISHPFHPQHVIKLFAKYPNRLRMFHCSCCLQGCNVFGYKCVECDFIIDLKCASVWGRIEHEAHKHVLSPNFVTHINDIICSACNLFRSLLTCGTCSFSLCLFCTMLPPIVNHRYCRCHGFKLRYSPIKDYHRDYYCDLCENPLQPKRWFYHCGDCDQFAHPSCLVDNAGDSNIKFGKRYKLPEHEHVLLLTRFTHEYSNCKVCLTSLNKGFAVGFKCGTCPYFKIHLECVESWKDIQILIRVLFSTVYRHVFSEH